MILFIDEDKVQHPKTLNPDASDLDIEGFHLDIGVSHLSLLIQSPLLPVYIDYSSDQVCSLSYR